MDDLEKELGKAFDAEVDRMIREALTAANRLLRNLSCPVHGAPATSFRAVQSTDPLTGESTILVTACCEAASKKGEDTIRHLF